MNTYGIEKHNIMTPKNVYRNLSPAVLTEMALKTEDCKLTDKGALLVETGKYTGRSPKDRYVVDEPTTTANINWNNENKKISEETFERIYGEIAAYLSNRDIYIFDGFAGADEKYRIGIRIINEYASQNLFMNNMLIRPTAEELEKFEEKFTVICAPGLKLNAEKEGINSEAAIILNFKKSIVIIAGSKYCGEMKKSVFSVMNYILRSIRPRY